MLKNLALILHACRSRDASGNMPPSPAHFEEYRKEKATEPGDPSLGRIDLSVLVRFYIPTGIMHHVRHLVRAFSCPINYFVPK